MLAILGPIWHTQPVRAKSVKQRIHAVLEWAIAMNLRNDNPADPPRSCPPHSRFAARDGRTQRRCHRQRQTATRQTGLKRTEA